jgi:voltage-gated sodium channel
MPKFLFLPSCYFTKLLLFNIQDVGKLKKIFLNDYFILCFVIANAILIFVQEFQLNGSFLDYFESLFTILFVIEMIVKIKEFGFSKYIYDYWNRLDFILVILSIPSLGIIFFNESTLHLNIFLTLRVFRAFKFFRLIRFFPNVNPLIISIKRALKASYIVIAGFFLLTFIVSLVTCSLYREIAPEYFSNPLNSFYSIFRLFSVEGWYEIPNLIASRSGMLIAFLSKLYFIILLLCGGILGMSLVNSIFVDAMVSDNNDDLKSEVSELTKKIDLLTSKIDELNDNNKFKI